MRRLIRRFVLLQSLIVSAKRFFESVLCDDADPKWDADLRKNISGDERGTVGDARPAFGQWVERGVRPHLVERTAAVAARDAERVRIRPLERLLFPLNADDGNLHPRPLRPFDVAEQFHLRLTRVAVEAVRIRRIFPDRLRGGFDVPLPGEVEFFCHVG